MVIFFHPDELELRLVHNIFEPFGHTSRLHTNFVKCSVPPITCTKIAIVAATFKECKLAPYPVKYLGTPLGTNNFN
jgi:hypothetical protein